MPLDPHLAFDIRHRLGTLDLDVRFIAATPWTVLFGPSGSGKSTILRAIAGLVHPHEGRIVVGSQTIFDSALHRSIPTHCRPVRWSAQRSALFPHKTVGENLALALPSNPARLTEALTHFRIAELAPRYPRQLSGGQQQRVAVARAALSARLHAEPAKLLLLDEPFTGLDADIRAELIDDLRSWLPTTPILSVTHDVAEAFLLQAEIITIARGRILAQGPAPEVLAPERARILQALGH